jgi:hypothetical protein
MAPDPHAIDADEFIISDREPGEKWTETTSGVVGKLDKKGADPSQKSTFFVVRTSREQETKAFWKSAPAHKEDLKPGIVVACSRALREKDVWSKPKTPGDARMNPWQITHVSNLADLDKNIVETGTEKCSLDAL